jgi:hypothetical protein
MTTSNDCQMEDLDLDLLGIRNSSRVLTGQIMVLSSLLEGQRIMPDGDLDGYVVTNWFRRLELAEGISLVR